MEKHSVACKHDDISVLERDRLRKTQNVRYLVSADRIRVE